MCALKEGRAARISVSLDGSDYDKYDRHMSKGRRR